jgi:hypothetical protein
MPYIKPYRRTDIYHDEKIDIPNIECAGDLNYSFTVLIHAYLAARPIDYQAINDIIGALEGAKAEFQRRIVAPYEDKKINENGDV